MTADLFLPLADLLPDALFLLTGDGTVLAANRRAVEHLGVSVSELAGRGLAALVDTPAESLAAYLCACSRTRQPIPGALVWRTSDGRGLRSPCEGAVLRPRAPGSEALLLLRLIPQEVSTSGFLALQQHLDELAREITRRQQVEQELRAQREQLRVTLASIGDAVTTTDAAGRVTFLNSVAEALTGWSGPEASGRPLEEVFRILNEETRLPVENPVQKVLREGQVVGLANHTVLVSKEGTERPIDDSGSPIRDDQGHITGVILVFRDVSERRAAERALRASEACFRAIIEQSWEAVALLDADGTVRYASPSTVRVLGFTSEEFVGRNAFDGMHPDDLARTTALFTQLLQTPGASLTAVYRYQHKNGSRRWLESTGTNLLNEPAVRAIVANYRDVTQQRADEEVRAHLAAIMASSEDAIIGKTLDGIITSWNAGAERLYGYAAAFVLGKPISLLIPPDHPDELPALMERLKRGERIEPYETERLRQDGTRVSVSVTISPIKDASGHIVGASAIARDITERKRAREERARLYHEVREASRRKEQFLTMLAHELRAPLSPLLTSAQVLRQSGGDPRSCEQAADIVQRQVRHLSRLVDDLLQVSRLQRDKVELRTERLDLGRLVRLAAEDRRSALEQAGLALTIAAPETPVWVRGDPIRLAQVVSNLLDNAQKFTDPGGQVAVRLTTDAGSRQAVLAIADTGVGIAPDELPHLFEAFAQADRSLDRSRGGLGLGLALVKGLVALHGGEVAAHSAGPGRGAEFVVRLPWEDEPAALTEVPVAPAQAGTGRKVVVIEDNRDAADSLRVLLELLGHNVQVAYTGLEGVRLATEWRPDAVISDIGLPGLNGYGVAEALRRHPATARTLLIALTGYGSDEDRQLAQASGFDHHVTKPADPMDLQELLAPPGTPGTL